MNFESAAAARGVAFTDLTTTNGNLSTQLRQQEDHIKSLQAELFNLKVAAETRITDVRLSNKTLQPYAHKNKQKPQWPTDLTEIKYNNINYC